MKTAAQFWKCTNNGQPSKVISTVGIITPTIIPSPHQRPTFIISSWWRHHRPWSKKQVLTNHRPVVMPFYRRRRDARISVNVTPQRDVITLDNGQRIMWPKVQQRRICKVCKKMKVVDILQVNYKNCTIYVWIRVSMWRYETESHSRWNIASLYRSDVKPSLYHWR